MKRPYHGNDASFSVGAKKRRRIEGGGTELVAGERARRAADSGVRSDEAGRERGPDGGGGGVHGSDWGYSSR